MAVDVSKFDLRLLERNFRNGLISEREYQSFLKDLPDLEGNLTEVSLAEIAPEAVGGETDEQGESDRGK